MNKERSTLLIALSILLIATIVAFLTGATVPKAMALETPKEPEVIATVPADILTATCSPKPVVTVVEEIVEESKPIAEQVWDAMKAKGWSDDVCAAILGNMMAECGGNTLDLNPYVNGDKGTSFGLCQWHAKRKSSMLNFNNQNYNTTDNLPTIEHQIDYLEYELQSYSFINSDKSYKELAYEFCVKFERPANKYKKAKHRQQLAEIAYQEFAIN